MTFGLPDFPPLFPDVEWWRLFVEMRLQGVSSAEACAEAGRRRGLKPRSWMRVLLAGDTMLSLPVSGGASALKNRPADSWELAPEAAPRRRKFEATLATLYGRTPFFHLLRETLLPGGGEEVTAREVCRDAFLKVEALLGLDNEELLAMLRERMARRDATLASMVEAYDAKADRRLSIIDVLARLGPDAIFTLLPTFLA